MQDTGYLAAALDVPPLTNQRWEMSLDSELLNKMKDEKEKRQWLN
jgi:hypothetical protein